MLTVTGIVILGCLWLFPTLMGNVDFQLDPRQLAVSIDETFSSLSSSSENQTRASSSVPEGDEPLQNGPTAQPVLVTKPTTLSFSLTAGGSIQINSTVQKALTDASGYRFSILFEELKGEVQGDLSIATLENVSISTEKLTDQNIPVDVLSAIQGSGLNTICLGYPNAFTGGVKGSAATKDAIRAAGMTPYGVYASQEERNTLCVVDVNGVSVGLLSYQNDLSTASKKKLSKEEQGFVIAPATLPTITADIQSVKAAGAQVVIVSLCWGKEGATSPTQAQKELAQGIANAGADVILGTHSGVVQTIEVLTANRPDGQQSQTLCAYSLGNLFTYDREKRSGISGLLLHAQVVYDLSTGTVSFDGLSYTPTYVWRGKEDNKTLYRVLVSDKPAPSYVQEEQKNVMERALALITDVMQNTQVKRRDPNAVTP